ncbi:MAG: hypothetical protein QT08_C0015G0012 [archaeon GW2011_AR17]|nr:MAG: hypothetical protein QT08_C0015G0012 [archaeon GW2011_AR17]MBS3154013.1 hypothetical protein [Candidatus Woesearchaeota archaeon]HIH15599.1 hypothetical protein [Nanoarchaeota archaeon]HIH59071.1 hypothetical protein [Nanoarchaeota archaeon]HII14642.1 hypothetical protein [Nanoarchaeota archaeon]
MALGNLFTGGIFTFIILIVIVFALWAVYKIIFAPILSFFGFGKKTLGQLGERTTKNWLDSWTRERDIAERETNDGALESKGSTALEEGADAVGNLDKLLITVQKSQNFNEERVVAAKEFVGAIERSVEESTKAFHEISASFQRDRADTKKIIKEYKQSIGDQKTIRQQTEERVGILGKDPINQKDPFAGNIMRLANEIQALEGTILAEENQDREQLQELVTIAETRDNKAKRIGKSLGKINVLLKKKPILPEIVPLQTLTEEIKIAIQDILTETKNMQSLLRRRQELSRGIMNIESQLRDLIQEQRKQILSSEANFADLQSRGAA